jgi:hypothetical protein
VRLLNRGPGSFVILARYLGENLIVHICMAIYKTVSELDLRLAIQSVLSFRSDRLRGLLGSVYIFFYVASVFVS